MRDLVRAVGAVREQAAEVDVGEVGVGAALGGGDAHLGRRGVVVELDEEALEELLRPLPRERAVGESALVEGQQVLVEVAGVEGVPAVELGDDGEVAEPVGLQRLVEVAGRVGRDAAADVGDLLQLRLALGVRSPRRELLRPLGVALGEAEDGVAGDVHGPELLALVPGLGVAAEVEGGDGGGDVVLEVEQAAPVDLVVEDGVAGRALLHELGEEAGLVGGVPLRGQGLEEAVAQRAAPPVGDDVPLVGRDDLRRDAGSSSSRASRGSAGPRRCGR